LYSSEHLGIAGYKVLLDPSISDMERRQQTCGRVTGVSEIREAMECAKT
jgi:hypothetical protein